MYIQGEESGGAAPRQKLLKLSQKLTLKCWQTLRDIFDGGSIPIVTELAKVSRSEVVLVGLGLSHI